MSPLILDYAINNKLTPFISMQTHYSLVYREDERDILPTLKVISTSCGWFGPDVFAVNIAFWSWSDTEVTSFG